jgi:hypothetical protein
VFQRHDEERRVLVEVMAEASHDTVVRERHQRLIGATPAHPIGWGGRLRSPGYSLSIGARWYHGTRSGWFVSLNFTDTIWNEFSRFDLNTSTSPANAGRLFTAGAVGGYRFKLKAFFVELGIGPLWYRERNSFTCQGTAPPCATLPQRGSVTHGWFPDAVVGTGFDL